MLVCWITIDWYLRVIVLKCWSENACIIGEILKLLVKRAKFEFLSYLWNSDLPNVEIYPSNQFRQIPRLPKKKKTKKGNACILNNECCKLNGWFMRNICMSASIIWYSSQYHYRHIICEGQWELALSGSFFSTFAEECPGNLRQEEWRPGESNVGAFV